eukprot:scaffold81964_cov29-Attheya_sp.AAC.3
MDDSMPRSKDLPLPQQQQLKQQQQHRSPPTRNNSNMGDGPPNKQHGGTPTVDEDSHQHTNWRDRSPPP